MRYSATLCILLFELFSPSPAFSTDSSQFAGTYQTCSMACVTIVVRADGTFSHTIAGDVFQKSTVSGTLGMVAPNLVIARSNQQPTAYPLVQRSEAQRLTISVTVRDPTELLSHAIVQIGCEIGNRTQETDLAGVATFPYCEINNLRVDYPGYVSAFYDDVRSGNTIFIVTLDSAEHYIDNELWLFHDGMLHIVTGSTLKRLP